LYNKSQVQEANELERPSWTSGPSNMGHYVALKHQNPITRDTAAEALKLTMKDLIRISSALVRDSRMNPVLTENLLIYQDKVCHMSQSFETTLETGGWHFKILPL